MALKEAMGSTQSIMIGPDGELYGASDPRSVDDLTAGIIILSPLPVGEGLNDKRRLQNSLFHTRHIIRIDIFTVS